jgi:hypothetical protein
MPVMAVLPGFHKDCRLATRLLEVEGSMYSQLLLGGLANSHNSPITAVVAETLHFAVPGS